MEVAYTNANVLYPAMKILFAAVKDVYTKVRVLCTNTSVPTQACVQLCMVMYVEVRVCVLHLQLHHACSTVAAWL